MRTFIAIAIVVSMHHFAIYDPTIPWIAGALFVGGFFVALAQDIKELVK